MSTKCKSRLAFLLPLGLVAGLATSCSSSPHVATVVVATGGVTCNSITGALTFTPPLTTKGGSAESTAITLNATGCATSGSNVSKVTRGTASATITDTSNACTGLLNSRPITVNITWTPATIHPSVLTFSGYAGSTGSGGDLGFTLPKSGDTAKVIGSFPGADHGAGSTSTAFSNQSGTHCSMLAGRAPD